MKDSFLYPIVFMLIAVIIFTGVLAVMYRMSETKINEYAKDNYRKLVLASFADALSEKTQIPAEEIMQSYPESFEEYVKPIDDETFARKAFEAVVDGETIAYGFEVDGKGLWGTMKGFVSTSTDFRTILGFRIVNQQETPGLGARIEEEWFLAQFKGLLFVQNPEGDDKGKVNRDYEFIAETLEPEGGQLRRVTGATISSKAVVDMLSDEFKEIYKIVRDKEL